MSAPERRKDDPAHIDATLPAGFLMTLHVAAGQRDDANLARAVSDSATVRVTEEADWKSLLRAQFEPSGFLVRELEVSLSEACRAARHGVPLVRWTRGTGWIALLDGTDRRARVVSADSAPVWLPVEELRGRLVESGAGAPAGSRAGDGVDQAARAESAEPTHVWLAIDGGLVAAAADTSAYEDDETGEHREKPRPFARLLDIVRPERGDVVAVILYSVFIGLLSLAIPIAVQQLVNIVAFGGLVQPVVVLAFLLLMGLAIGGSLSAFQALLAETLQQRIFVRACLDLASRLPRVADEAFGERPAPAFVNRFFDIVTLQKTGARLLLDGSSVLLQTSAGLLILSFYHPLMLALSVFLLGAMAGVAIGFGRGATDSAVRESTAKYALAEWMEELVSHRTAFRTTAGRSHASRRADALVTAWVGARRQHYRIVFRQFVAALGLQVVVNTGLLALGGFLVVTGELTLGQLVASEIIVASVVASFARLAKHFESYYDLLAAVDKVGGLLDLPLERSSPAGGQDELDRPSRVVARNLSFACESQKGIERVSFDFAAGDRIAVLGGHANGQGILMDLLAGLRKPDAGHVTIGGHDLRELGPETLRNAVALVREPQILPATVLENLMLARVGATVEDAREALERVVLLDEIRGLPDGLDSVLQTDGRPLDPSQAVRLEIARALIARPALLLVDDALLRLADKELKPVLDTLFDPRNSWTLVVATRDPRVVTRCNERLELSEGQRVHTAVAGPARVGWETR